MGLQLYLPRHGEGHEMKSQSPALPCTKIQLLSATLPDLVLVARGAHAASQHIQQKLQNVWD